MVDLKQFLIVCICSHGANLFSMSCDDATDKCQTSLEQATKDSQALRNPHAKKIAETAIDEMSKIIEQVSNCNSITTLPDITERCVQHGAFVLWLKEIEHAIKPDPPKVEQKPKEKEKESSPKNSHAEHDEPEKPKQKQGKVMEVDEYKGVDANELAMLLEKECR